MQKKTPFTSNISVGHTSKNIWALQFTVSDQMLLLFLFAPPREPGMDRQKQKPLSDHVETTRGVG